MTATMFPVSPAIPRAALVTGGARRIGRAIVRMLASQGFAVAIHCRSGVAEGDALLAEIGGRGCVLTADLAREGESATLVDRAVAALGPLGVLVNNASTFRRDDWMDVTRDSWDHHIEPNLRAPFVLAQNFARQLSSGGDPAAEGMVLNMLDQRVWNPTPFFMSYTVSKAGLWMLTQTMALALAPRIRVNAIGPGPVLPAAGQSDEHFAAMCASTPLQRGASPEEVARAALALLALPAVTGQMIALDGGQHLNWRPG